MNPGDVMYSYNMGYLETITVLKEAIQEGASVPTQYCRDQTGRTFWCSVRNMAYVSTKKEAYRQFMSDLIKANRHLAEEVLRLDRQIEDNLESYAKVKKLMEPER